MYIQKRYAAFKFIFIIFFSFQLPATDLPNAVPLVIIYRFLRVFDENFTNAYSVRNTHPRETKYFKTTNFYAL